MQDVTDWGESCFYKEKDHAGSTDCDAEMFG